MFGALEINGYLYPRHMCNPMQGNNENSLKYNRH